MDLEELVPKAVENFLKTSTFKQLLKNSLVTTIKAKMGSMEEKVAKQDSIIFDLQSQLNQKSDETERFQKNVDDLTDDTSEMMRKLNDLDNTHVETLSDPLVSPNHTINMKTVILLFPI